MRQLRVPCLSCWGCKIQIYESHGAHGAGSLKAQRLCSRGLQIPPLCPTPSAAHQSTAALAKASLAARYPSSVVNCREAPIKYHTYDQKRQKQEKPWGQDSEQLTPGFITSLPCHCEDSPDCPILSSGLLLEALYEISPGSRGPRQRPGFC